MDAVTLALAKSYTDSLCGTSDSPTAVEIDLAEHGIDLAAIVFGGVEQMAAEDNNGLWIRLTENPNAVFTTSSTGATIKIRPMACFYGPDGYVMSVSFRFGAMVNIGAGNTFYESDISVGALEFGADKVWSKIHISATTRQIPVTG